MFAVGDIVDIKGHGRASVLEPIVEQPDSPHFGRYLLRYHERGTTYWCRPNLMRRMNPTKKRVLVTRSTSAYRDAIVHNVDWPDVCLEIGCHEGLTTNILSNRTSFVTGVDTAAAVVEIARQRHPHLTFHQLDGLQVDATRSLSPTGAFTRICIDISGKAPLDLICQMIVTQAASFPQASFIVKNEQLFDTLAARSHLQKQQEETLQVVGAHDTQSAKLQAGVEPVTARVAPCTTAPGDVLRQQLEGAASSGCAYHGHRAARDSGQALTRDEYKMRMRRVVVEAGLAAAHQPMSAPIASSSTVTTITNTGGSDATQLCVSDLGDCCDPGITTDATAQTMSPMSLVAAAVGGASAAVQGCPLEALLGNSLLFECELFLHQSQLPRTRPRRRHGKNPPTLVADTTTSGVVE